MWYVRRLGRMSFSEVAFRLREAGKRKISNYQSFDWSNFAVQGNLRPIAQLKQLLNENLNDPLRRAIGQSSRLLHDGSYSALGMNWPKREPGNLFPQSLWALDPITGKLWQNDTFCFSVSYRHQHEGADIKYVWELHRLQFLQGWAADWVINQNPASLKAIEIAIESWFEANPPFKGVAWNSGIELALRAVSLAIVVTLCGSDLRKTTLDSIEQILRAHYYWLSRFPSRYSSANNHMIAELLGELVIASVLPDLGGSRFEIQRQLGEQAVLQFHADGVNAEQSPTYGAFSAEMLLFAELISKSSGDTLGILVQERLQNFAEYISWLCDASGKVPEIGDNDSGRVLK